MESATLAPRRVKTSLPPEYRDFDHQAEPLATFLGVFSLGLGLAEVLVPRRVADATGVRYPGLLRAYGVREIVSGLGILANRQPTMWLMSRVAGDLMDLATIGAAYAQARGDDRRRLVRAAVAVAGVAALDVACARAHG